MFNITDEFILDLSTNDATYLKGKQYYTRGRIVSLKFDPTNLIFHGTVAGTQEYKVKASFYANGHFNEASCTCPAYRKYMGYCKHVAAVLMAIKEKDKMGKFDHAQSNTMAKKILDFFHFKQTEMKVDIEMEITYEFEPNEYNDSYLSLRIGEGKLYKVKSIKKLLESMDNNEEIHYGKEFTFHPERHRFKDIDQPIINFLKEIYDHEKYLEESSFHGLVKSSLFKGKRILLTANSLKRFFQIVKERNFNAIINGKDYEDIQILHQDIPMDFLLTKEDHDLLLKVNYEDALIPLVNNGEYFFTGRNIYRPSEYQRENFTPFYNAFNRQKNKTIRISKEYNERFVSEVYPFVKRIGSISIDEKVQSSIYKPPFKPEVYLDRNENKMTADIKFIYGDITINPFAHNEKQTCEGDKILLRDIEKEKEILAILEDAEFKVKNNQIFLDDDEKIFIFLYDKITKLQEVANTYYSEAFKNIKIRDTSSFSGGIKLNPQNDMLSFDFEIEGINPSELIEVFDSLKEKRKYYKLKDGSFLPLDMGELEKIGEMVDYLELSNKDLEKDHIEIPKFRALYLDEHLKECGLQYIKRNLYFKELVQNIREPGDMDYTIPQELDQTLRHYQTFGFKWLKTLASYGLGGILADDMGLGKTLQVLTFLLSEKREKGSHPSLIVAPTSLVYNWYAEIEKFTPSLNTLIISGNKDERQSSIEKIMEYDIVITSYPLIRRDIELYENITFKYCILDEAQYIKNAMSQNAKSVKEIRAKNYFALTGTPIENGLTELWSIFDYIMPGYLLSNTKFKKKYEKPIIKDQDKKALEELGKHIRPFILRRLKKDVLKELPEKIEHKIVAELTMEQKKIYLAYLNQIKGEIEDEIKTKGFGKSHIKILSGLTRLRQICCHPSLFVENFNGESGKLLLLEEILNDSIDSGHRILLFSQFTSMLKIIRDMLEDRGIEYQYLDGSTDMQVRGKLVNDFNEGKGKVFLISLKAGGTGLNLTGADTVIHFDIWWNPAVEEQATDRAYRIGQKNSVHVMKLITKGTIEEKIFKLQEKKRKMIDTVIQPGETLISKLSEEEIKDIFEIS